MTGTAPSAVQFFFFFLLARARGSRAGEPVTPLDRQA